MLTKSMPLFYLLMDPIFMNLTFLRGVPLRLAFWLLCCFLYDVLVIERPASKSATNWLFELVSGSAYI